MSGVNKVILVGNLGKDPEVRYLENGTAVANFPIATSESYKDRNGNRVDQTEWHNIVLWRGLAEVAEKYLKKGNQVFIEGKIRTRSWDDKDGNKRYTTEIVGDQMTMLGGRPSDNQDSGYQSQPQSSAPQVNESNPAPSQGAQEEDDLPF